MKTSIVQCQNSNRRVRTSARFIRRWVLSVGRWTFCLFITAAAHAGPRTSANYHIVTDTTDTGGKRATSTHYTNDGSAGAVVGISTVAAPAETAKHGYIGQLYDVVALQLTATPATINETASRQLAAAPLADDATTLAALDPSTVAWSVVSGPLASISSAGLLTAGIVYQATPATAQGVFGGLTGTLNLTVLDSIPDNFGSYAGDGLGDDWQVQYFGLNNPLAAPTANPDGDAHDNLFEFIAGLVPTDSSSHFRLTLAPVAGQPTHKRAIFSPLVAGRTYTVEFRTSLSTGAWQTLTGTTQNDNGNERTVTDPNATGPRKFYRVQITKP